MKDLKVFFDGSCEPVNPGGTAKWGVAIIENETIIKTLSGTIGKGEGMTNNVAEYHGLIAALEYLKEHHIDDYIEVFGDSNMVINMTTGAWGKKNPHKKMPHLIPLVTKTRELFVSFENLTIEWIPREQNGIADFLSKQG